MSQRQEQDDSAVSLTYHAPHRNILLAHSADHHDFCVERVERDFGGSFTPHNTSVIPSKTSTSATTAMFPILDRSVGPHDVSTTSLDYLRVRSREAVRACSTSFTFSSADSSLCAHEDGHDPGRADPVWETESRDAKSPRTFYRRFTKENRVWDRGEQRVVVGTQSELESCAVCGHYCKEGSR